MPAIPTKPITAPVAKNDARKTGPREHLGRRHASDSIHETSESPAQNTYNKKWLRIDTGDRCSVARACKATKRQEAEKYHLQTIESQALRTAARANIATSKSETPQNHREVQY